MPKAKKVKAEKTRGRLDLATIAGIGTGVAIIGAAAVAGKNALQFVNLPGLLIVLGGTLAATLARFPFKQFGSALKIAGKAFRNDLESPEDIIALAQRQARIVRDHGLLALEKFRVRNPFFRKGLLMCADGCKPEYIRRVMGEEIALMQERHETGQRIFRAIGDAAPAFGIIGTLVGLVQMLGDISDPSTIGPAMSLALLTTLYGALIAHLIANPIADKLELRSAQERANMVLIMEGILNIQQGEHPRAMGEFLEAYVPSASRRDGRPVASTPKKVA